jgi:hypothetical protein
MHPSESRAKPSVGPVVGVEETRSSRAAAATNSGCGLILIRCSLSPQKLLCALRHACPERSRRAQGERGRECQCVRKPFVLSPVEARTRNGLVESRFGIIRFLFAGYPLALTLRRAQGKRVLLCEVSPTRSCCACRSRNGPQCNG